MGCIRPQRLIAKRGYFFCGEPREMAALLSHDCGVGLLCNEFLCSPSIGSPTRAHNDDRLDSSRTRIAQKVTQRSDRNRIDRAFGQSCRMAPLFQPRLPAQGNEAIRIGDGPSKQAHDNRQQQRVVAVCGGTELELGRRPNALEHLIHYVHATVVGH